MPELLHIENLSVMFILEGSRIPAVDNATLRVKENEVVVLAGESGSGKSVTALSITKNLPQTARITSGKVMFEGQDLLTLHPKELQRTRGKQIAYIFQEPTSYLNPVFSIGNQIAEAVTIHQNKHRADAYAEAERLLGLVKITRSQDVMRSYPHQLSGGMNQRVMIAMALACQPKLLVADEPTTSLDVTIEAQVLQLLMEIRKEFSFSLLFITHNLSLAKKIADKVYVMHRGRIVEEGDVKTIFTAPGHFHTKELIEAYEKIGKI